MTDACVPVDLFNPGQVFACLGLMEVSELLHGDVEAAFDWEETASEARFALSVGSDEDPIASAFDFLKQANLSSLLPEGEEGEAKARDVPSVRVPRDMPFPMPLPSSPSALPAMLSRTAEDQREKQLVIDSWGDGAREGLVTRGLDNVKFWGGAGGYPGVALLRDALAAVREHLDSARAAPWSLSAPQSSSFRFDWRRDYIPIEIGFSLNEHGFIEPMGFPLVEVFAVIGLAHARPKRETKLRYQYGVLGMPRAGSSSQRELLPPSYLRAALGLAALPFPTRRFRMELGWPGKENQARCITTVLEIPANDSSQTQ